MNKIMDAVDFLLIVTGIVAGFIDSIAGGGGLVTLPVFGLVTGPGAIAVGTNKIVAVASTLVSLGVYLKNGHVAWKASLLFALTAGLGSAAGGLVGPLVPPELFRWFLAISCPIILWLIWRKDLWVRQEGPHSPAGQTISGRLLASGFFCGFYDGIWGPGGGTFMFLALFFWARLPLIAALASAKLANLLSAGAALGAYSWSGHVQWRTGLPMAAGVVLGAFFGAELASAHAARIVRWLLLTVAILLTARLIFL